MEVTDVLRDRMQEPSGLQRMVVASIALHAVILSAALLSPGGLFQRAASRPANVMSITLDGGEGPRNGGITQLGGRPVQALAPPDAKREAVRPPAVKTPEMTLPKQTAKTVKPSSSPAVRQAPEEARGRTPTRGAEMAAGSAVAETGARGQGFGLSSGGGGGTGSSLDVANFCCPDYLVLMIDRIRTNWIRQAEVAGNNIVKFTIQRDGRIADVELEKSSGYQNLDLTSQRALAVTRTLPPLPSAFPNATLTVHLNFQYQR